MKKFLLVGVLIGLLSVKLSAVSVAVNAAYGGQTASGSVSINAAGTSASFNGSGSGAPDANGNWGRFEVYVTTGPTGQPGTQVYHISQRYGSGGPVWTNPKTCSPGTWFIVYAQVIGTSGLKNEDVKYLQAPVPSQGGGSATKINLFTPGVSSYNTYYTFQNASGTQVSTAIVPKGTAPSLVVPNSAGTDVTWTAWQGYSGGVYSDWTPGGPVALTAGGTLLGTDSIGAGTAGATGPAGAVGATGPAGATGATGSAGATGPAGPTGATGPQGVQGVAGVTGPVGLTGARGASGAVGPTGADSTVPGPVGPIGLTGDVGPVGPTGADGVSDIPGPQGLQGVAGVDGIDGAPGVGGAGGAGADGGLGGEGGAGGAGGAGGVGIQGVQGIQGEMGLTGAQGEAGAVVDLSGLTSAVTTLHTDNATTATALQAWHDLQKENRRTDQLAAAKEKADAAEAFAAAKADAEASGTGRASGAAAEWSALQAVGTGAANSFTGNGYVAGTSSVLRASPILGDNGYATSVHAVSGLGPLLADLTDCNPLTSEYFQSAMPTGGALKFCQWVKSFIEWAVVVAFLVWTMGQVREQCFVLGMTPRQQIGGATDLVLHTNVVGNSVGVIPASGMYAAGIVMSSTLLLAAPVIFVAAFSSVGFVPANAETAATAAKSAPVFVANVLSYLYVVLPVATLVTAFCNAGLVKTAGIAQWVITTVTFRLFQL